MGRMMSTDGRRELLRSIGERYRAGSREAKCRILDEFVAITGYHRKHAIRILRAADTNPNNDRLPRQRRYDDVVGNALLLLWEASDRVCGKRLRPLIPLLIEALERHGHLRLEGSVREKVISASPATIDRLLSAPRASGHWTSPELVDTLIRPPWRRSGISTRTPRG